MCGRSLLFFVIFSALSQDCGGQWERLGNTCYLVRLSRKDWGEARKNCQTYSADLAIVKSSQVKVIGTYLKTK